IFFLFLFPLICPPMFSDRWVFCFQYGLGFLFYRYGAGGFFGLYPGGPIPGLRFFCGPEQEGNAWANMRGRRPVFSWFFYWSRAKPPFFWAGIFRPVRR